MKIPKAPAGLKTPGRVFWRKVLSEFRLEESHDLQRLEMACRTLDNLKEAEDRVKTDGMFTTNRYNSVVEHPALKSIKDFRMLFIKIVREMNLDVSLPDESRPPRKY